MSEEAGGVDLNDLMEWALLPRTMSLISGAEIDAALREGAKGAKAAREVRKRLLGWMWNMRLD